MYALLYSIVISIALKWKLPFNSVRKTQRLKNELNHHIIEQLANYNYEKYMSYTQKYFITIVPKDLPVIPMEFLIICRVNGQSFFNISMSIIIPPNNILHCNKRAKQQAIYSKEVNDISHEILCGLTYMFEGKI